MGSQKAWDILNLARTTAYYVNYWKSPCTAENVLSQQNEKQSKAAWIFFFFDFTTCLTFSRRDLRRCSIRFEILLLCLKLPLLSDCVVCFGLIFFFFNMKNMLYSWGFISFTVLKRMPNFKSVKPAEIRKGVLKRKICPEVLSWIGMRLKNVIRCL